LCQAKPWVYPIVDEERGVYAASALVSSLGLSNYSKASLRGTVKRHECRAPKRDAHLRSENRSIRAFVLGAVRLNLNSLEVATRPE
jgi:hypothetical protein